MKKCARCDFEYDDVYDGCPRCVTSIAAPRVGMSQRVPGNIGASVGGTVAYLFLAFLLGAATGTALAGFFLALVAGIAVGADIAQIHGRRPGLRVPGSEGVNGFLWGFGVFFLAIVFLPWYLYIRPRIVAAYSE